MQINRILITGASGFLGKVISSSFANLEHDVSSLGTQSTNDIICDLKNTVPVLPYNYDVIIHAAGKAHSIPRSPKEEKEFYDVNYQGSINLCNAIERMEIKPSAVVFISTVAVYGRDRGLNINENSPMEGSTAYAKSKIQAEEYLQMWAIKNNITLGILRLPLIVGPNPPGNLGVMIQAIKNGRYLSIGNASANKSMVWAKDVAEIIPKLTEVGGIYNLTDGHHPSFGELEKEISKCLRKKSPLVIPLWIARVLGRVGDMVGVKAPINTEKLNKITSSLTFDDTNARNNLKWKPHNVLNKISEIV